VSLPFRNWAEAAKIIEMSNTPFDEISRAPSCVLSINGGSSSIKFALYKIRDPPKRTLYGTVDCIGRPDATLTFTDLVRNQQDSRSIEVPDHESAVRHLLDWLDEQVTFSSIKAIGHRLVHGMTHTEPERITQELLTELHRISSYDPDHLPSELKLIESLRLRQPQLPQVACFDTAFHSKMPRIARLLPIPRRFDRMGVQRYGFHGLSYAYLMEELGRLAGVEAAQGRTILAHLGSGASLAAVVDGQSVDTSMGFTPTGGVPMGSRSGDLDPGVAWRMMQAEKLTTQQFNNLINHESGLLGVSETSSDMRELLKHEHDDVRAAEAIALFCYHVKKWIGAFSAALGGLDTLVFSGGIGENSPPVRHRICQGLEFLGIELDETQNSNCAQTISRNASRVAVRVIRTDEELMIAKMVCRVLGLMTGKERHDNRRENRS
jgi:acetate kinase